MKKIIRRRDIIPYRNPLNLQAETPANYKVKNGINTLYYTDCNKPLDSQILSIVSLYSSLKTFTAREERKYPTLASSKQENSFLQNFILSFTESELNKYKEWLYSLYNLPYNHKMEEVQQKPLIGKNRVESFEESPVKLEKNLFVSYIDENLQQIEKENLLQEIRSLYSYRDFQIFSLYIQGERKGKIGKIIGCSSDTVARTLKRIRKDYKVNQSLQEYTALIMQESIKPQGLTHYPDNLKPINTPCVVTKYGSGQEKFSYTTSPTNSKFSSCSPAMVILCSVNILSCFSLFSSFTTPTSSHSTSSSVNTVMVEDRRSYNRRLGIEVANLTSK